ncbi:flippase [Natronosalvus caseinilyticus]|uniref:flippase n=1 Tax=Natronosalvus caseinilyticus TaxID=2953747 RepID=UPI0028AAF7A8|nr:flippase [Natronosalvus caseinilyticus]
MSSRTLNHIVRGFKAMLVARAIYMASSAVLMVVLARFLLDPDGYGTLFWAIGVLSVVQLIAGGGLGKSAARYLAEYREKAPDQIPRVLELTVAVQVLCIAAVSVILLVGHDRIAAMLGDGAVAPFLAAGAVYVLAMSFHGLAIITFQGFNMLGYSAAVQAIGGVSRLLFAVAFVVAGFGALGAFFGYVVGYAIAAVFGITVLYLQCYRTFERASSFEPGLPRRVLEYSVPLTATRGANVIDKQIDIVLVGFFLNPVAVAFYTLAKQVVDFVLAPADSLGFTISPNFGEQKAAGDIEYARTLYETALTNTLLLYVPAAVGLAIVADPFVILVFGGDYAGAVPVLQVLCAFVVLQAITNLTSDSLDYLGRARARAMAKGGTALANFGLNVVLIPTIGVVGAAIATVATHSIYVGVNLYVVHAELSLRLEELAATVGKIVAITGVMGLLVVVLAPFISSLGMLFASIAVGVVVWAGLAFASGLIDPQDVRMVLGSGSDV